jgi:hypothetical protein
MHCTVTFFSIETKREEFRVLKKGEGNWRGVGRDGVKLMNQLIISRPKVVAHNYTELHYIKGTPTKFSPTTSINLFLL